MVVGKKLYGLWQKLVCFHWRKCVWFSLPFTSIADEWQKIEAIHDEFHEIGEVGIEAVKAGQQESAQECYNKAEILSKRIFGQLDKVTVAVEDMTTKGISLFGINQSDHSKGGACSAC